MDYARSRFASFQLFAQSDSLPKPPLSFADFTWLTGSSRQKTAVLDSKYFTAEFRADISYIGDFNQVLIRTATTHADEH